MSRLFKSRKFLVLLVDSGFGLAALLVAFFIKDQAVTVLVASVFAILQPVFIGVVASIAYEDGKQIEAGSHPSLAKASRAD